jgi:hypothetical protein
VITLTGTVFGFPTWRAAVVFTLICDSPPPLIRSYTQAAPLQLVRIVAL